jgi:hypothetical protein
MLEPLAIPAADVTPKDLAADNGMRAQIRAALQRGLAAIKVPIRKRW